MRVCVCTNSEFRFCCVRFAIPSSLCLSVCLSQWVWEFYFLKTLSKVRKMWRIQTKLFDVNSEVLKQKKERIGPERITIEFDRKKWVWNAVEFQETIGVWKNCNWIWELSIVDLFTQGVWEKSCFQKGIVTTLVWSHEWSQGSIHLQRRSL
jgi:hypothetical protein